VPARPIFIVHTAHGFAGPALACAAHDCAALHASAHRSGHRSPGAHRGTAGGGATVAEVEQGEALVHPRRRGHPPSKWVEAASDRSFLPTGRVEKPGRRRRSPMRWGLRWPAGSCVGVERERKLSLKCTRRKRRQGGYSGLLSPWRGSQRRRQPDNGGGVLGQRHSAQTVMWSASNMGDGSVGTGVCEVRQGEARAASAAQRRLRTRPVGKASQNDF
jgi:hypothetical protein